MRAQAGEGCLDVVDDEEDVADARGVGRRRTVVALVRGRAVLGQLDLAVAIRGPQDHDIRPHALEPVYPVHRAALDGRLALQFQPQCGEERGRRREVVDDDADVLQALDGHERPPGSSCGVYSSCSRYFGIVVPLVSWAAPLAALHLMSGAGR